MQTETPEYEANKRVSENVSKVRPSACSHLQSWSVVLKSVQFVLRLLCQLSEIFSSVQKMHSCVSATSKLSVIPTHAYDPLQWYLWSRVFSFMEMEFALVYSYCIVTWF